jgi:hypothetical protein
MVVILISPRRKAGLCFSIDRVRFEPLLKGKILNTKEVAMKRLVLIVLVVIVVMSFGIGSALAANSLKQGAAGINVNVDDDFVIKGKYFVTKDVAVLAGFGFGVKGDDAEGTDFGIGGGIRKYLSTEDFAPFVGASIFYRTTQDGDQEDWNILGEFGAEYFMHKQFSIEGSVGFGYFSSETTVGAFDYKETTFGTQRFGLSLNFYFM